MACKSQRIGQCRYTFRRKFICSPTGAHINFRRKKDSKMALTNCFFSKKMLNEALLSVTQQWQSTHSGAIIS